MLRPYLIYEITPRCNLNCLYCYNVWKENVKYPKGELTLPDIKRLFHKILGGARPKWIILSGGEPLVRQDVAAIASFFRERNFRVGLATNGTLLDESKVRQLTASGVSYFEISLNSPGKPTYTALSGRNLVKKARQAILLVKKFRMPLTVAFTLTKLNYHDIGEMIELCYAFSVDSLALNRFVAAGAGLRNKGKLSLTKQELIYVLKIAEQKQIQLGLPINVTLPVEACEIDHRPYPHLNFGTCGCGRFKWALDPLGNLRTCEQNPEILGNLFEENFSKLSRLESVAKFRQNNARLNCSRCQYLNHCGGGCRFLRKCK